MIDFIGLTGEVDTLDRFQRAENQSATGNFRAWHEWTSQECREFNNLCGNHMLRYGYGREPEWIEKLEGV
jgi:hypothetical protein